MEQRDKEGGSSSCCCWGRSSSAEAATGRSPASPASRGARQSRLCWRSFSTGPDTSWAVCGRAVARASRGGRRRRIGCASESFPAVGREVVVSSRTGSVDSLGNTCLPLSPQRPHANCAVEAMMSMDCRLYNELIPIGLSGRRSDDLLKAITAKGYDW